MNRLPLTPDAVAEIVLILDGSGYDRLDIQTSAFRLRVQRETGAQVGEGWSQEWEFVEPGAGATGEATVQVEELPEGLVGIVAPLPGTFYRAPQPGAPPFVEIGDEVSKDTVVGIIETMKLMNPVHAGCTGNIQAIQVRNAEMVDGGTTLMHVRPA